MLQSVGDLCSKQDPAILEVLDLDSKRSGFLLAGMSMQALDGSDLRSTELKVSCLQALRSFLHPSIAGPAFLDAVLFDEMTGLFSRLVLTENDSVRLAILEIVQQFVDVYGIPYLMEEEGAKARSILRLIVSTLSTHVPELSNHSFSRMIFLKISNIS